ncbi:YihY/virulence factor BrkB family protein [Halorussus gelatinilyticus]|uniref:YihY/virulence factor BrkB family protein n=1 Tax=Halorussus gelatinilyticus TaxID=2937524 RepID=A0A8U0IEJ4_9EURY|nr:YihY/virulence factor BrkB family protein [Halorussus gelatinilyticus]UPV99327.1 YihY/virulence factor BrkB family protein [Halorussus gelatinilyticus]
MTSLAEAYEENVGEVGNVRLLYLGVGLFAAGALLVVLGILVATTSLHATLGLGVLGAREVAGVLAGLGVPAVFVGIFSVLPASERVRAAAAIGAGVSILGVALFTYAYPRHWAGYNRQLTLPVVAVYFFGVLVTFGCLFVAVVNFKTRNDPGGTVTLEVAHEGEVRTVEVRKGELDEFEDIENLNALQTELADSAAGDPENDPDPVSTDPSETGLGGVAFMGATPDGETPTQTNQPSGRSATGASGRGARPTSDGGTTANDIRSPLDDADAPTRTQGTTDAYCGNCQYFKYVRTNEGMKPHCGFYGREMDDMDACEEWQPNG